LRSERTKVLGDGRATAAVLLLVGVLGCQTARVNRPLTGEVGGNDANEQLEFWHRLADRPVTSNDEAFHGLLMFLDGDDPAEDYAGRVNALKSRGMLPAGFDEPAGRAVERGTLAVAILKALDIRGGLALRLLGPTPRYAVRELVFMELYPPSSPNQTFSGAEFLGIIGKVEDYQRQQRAARRPGPQGPPVMPEPRPGDLPAPPGRTQTSTQSG
jgi:hypothetical protein